MRRPSRSRGLLIVCLDGPYSIRARAATALKDRARPSRYATAKSSCASRSRSHATIRSAATRCAAPSVAPVAWVRASVAPSNCAPRAGSRRQRQDGTGVRAPVAALQSAPPPAVCSACGADLGSEARSEVSLDTIAWSTWLEYDFTILVYRAPRRPSSVQRTTLGGGLHKTEASFPGSAGSPSVRHYYRHTPITRDQHSAA